MTNTILTAGSKKVGNKLIGLPNVAEGEPSSYIIFHDSPRRKICTVYKNGNVDYSGNQTMTMNDVMNVATIVNKIAENLLF